MGVASRLRCANSSLTVAVQRVSTRPGTTQLTCTAGAWLCAMPRVRFIAAALLAE